MKKIFNWWQVILNERYGVDFKIENAAGGFSLSRLGDSRQIVFPYVISGFYEAGDTSLPCVNFDLEKEGFLFPVDKIIPQPGLKEPLVELMTVNSNGVQVNYDILGLTYWMLSRQEEVNANRNILDAHGRFPATASHAFKFDYLERPIVDEWLCILGQIIQKIWPDIVFKKHQFSMKVSHDVDRPSRFGFNSFFQLIKKIGGSVLRKDFQSAINAPNIWLQGRLKIHPRDPYNTFEWLMDVSEKNNLKSAFYFICGGEHPLYDADYKLSYKPIQKLIKKIEERGHEIGLHPSYLTYKDEKSFLKEVNNLKRTCQELNVKQSTFGGRMHYLRWEPSTMMLWEKAGLAYDSTLSYADRPGFRCGTCFEYPAINPITKEILSLRIRPLVVMECSIMSPSYLGLGEGELALNKVLELKKVCNSVSGCFTLLWHNSELNINQKKLYKKILDA